MMAIGGYLNKKDLGLCSLLGAFCVFIFKDIIIGRHLLFGSDFVAFYLGIKEFLYHQIHTYHSIPFWNPFIFGGIPFWAHFESTIFYPLDFLFWIISPEKAYGHTMFIHLVLAGIFMYILSRSLNIRHAGSFVAAAVFISNGFIMANLGQMFRVHSYIWIPLIIYFLNKALTSKTPYFNATLAGLLWGVQILAGSPQDAFYTFLAAFLFLGYSVKHIFKKYHYSLKILAIASLLFVIGPSVAAIQIIPAFEFIEKSVRAAFDNYDFVTLGSYPPQGIITTVMPHFFGSYVKGNFWVNDVPWSIPEYNLYVGILPIILLFFISYRCSDNRKVVAFAVGLAIFSFVLALGSHTPVYKLAYLFPGFDRIRAPAKIIVLWALALGLLAGKGMDNLFNHSKASLLWRAGLSLCFVSFLIVLDLLFHFDRSLVLKFFSPFVLNDAIPDKMNDAANIICVEFHRLAFLGTIILLSILFWMRGTLSPKLSAVFLCAILLTDLAYVNRGAVKHYDQVYNWMAKTKYDLDMSIGKDKSVYRVGSFQPGMGPNLEMYLGYQTIGGYTPLFLHRYYEYMNHYYNGQLPEGCVWFPYGSSKNRILMDLLNVKYEIFYDTREYALRQTHLPRAFIVPNYKIMRKEEVLDYLVTTDFNPTKIVLFEKDDLQTHRPQHPLQKSKTPGRVKIISYKPDHIVLVTDSRGSGYLFLSEIFYPGWKAFVDDQPKRILRGNYLFRVIELPEGHHVVRLVFDPLSIKVGISITVFTLFMLLNVMVYHFGKRSTFFKTD